MPRVILTKALMKEIAATAEIMETPQAEYFDIRSRGLSLMQYRSGRQSFFFTKAFNKNRYRSRIGDPRYVSLVSARQIADRWSKEIEEGGNPIEKRNKANQLLSDFFEIEYLPISQATKKSWPDDVSRWTHHIEPSLRNKSLFQVTKRDIVSIQQNVATIRSPATANRVVNLLKAVFSLAVDMELLERSPARKVSMLPEPKHRRQFMTAAQINLMLGALKISSHEDTYNVVKFLSLTGLRSSEAGCLLLENIDLARGVIMLPNTKAGEGRYVGLSDAAGEILKYQINKYGNIGFAFRAIDGQRKVGDPRLAMKKACLDAGLPPFTPHSLRHSFAVIAVEKGVPLYHIRAALGHKCQSTTEHYVQITSPVLKNVASTVSDALAA